MPLASSLRPHSPNFPRAPQNTRAWTWTRGRCEFARGTFKNSGSVLPLSSPPLWLPDFPRALIPHSRYSTMMYDDGYPTMETGVLGMDLLRREVDWSGNNAGQEDSKFLRQATQKKNEKGRKLLVQAGRQVNERMDQDEKKLDAFSSLDFQGTGNYRCQNPPRNLIRIKSTPIPAGIIKAYAAEPPIKSFNGILPEIMRAYITMDNRLFLWNYHQGDDFMLYEELDQIIVSVGIVRPGPSTGLPPNIKYILVLTTPVDVILIGMEFRDDRVYNKV
eukprot:1014253-Amorphochlora_amoeboformis.AAC.1